MNQSEESIEQLKAQVKDLTHQLQALAQEKGQKLSENADGVMETLKKELERRASEPGHTPLQTAIAALGLGLIQEFEPKVKETLKGAAEKTTGLAGELGQGFSEGLDKTIAASKKARTSIGGYVRENPWKALAFAAVVGILIGRAAHRDKGHD